MRILFVVPYVPSRIRIRPYEFIRFLGQRGHSVTVVTQPGNSQEWADVEKLRTICETVMALEMPGWRSLLNSALAVPGKAPLQSVYSWNPLLAEKLLMLTDENNRAGNFDVVHVEHLRGVRFGLYLKRQRSLPVVWDSVDCISHLFRQSARSNPRRVSRLLNRFDLPRTVAYERQVVHQFDRVLVTSAVDRQAFLDLQPPGGVVPRIEVIPQGVDLDYFQPNPSGREADTIVVSGKMSYHANVRMVLQLVKEIMPLVWQQNPQVKVWVVGKDPTPELQKLAGDGRIHVTGEVEDVRPYLQRVAVAAAPVCYGAGIQNKVLEAMACATPVVASPAAVSALQVKVGKDVLVAESAEGFAAEILKLLRDIPSASQVGRAGRQYVEENHQWITIVKRLESIYTEVSVEEGTKKP